MVMLSLPVHETSLSQGTPQATWAQKAVNDHILYSMQPGRELRYRVQGSGGSLGHLGMSTNARGLLLSFTP